MRIENRVVPVKTVEPYLPHRPPMVWIDDVLSFSEKQGHCRVRLKSDGLYMDSQGLRPSSCLEFIAQAYGFISVCHHIYIMDPNSKPLSKAFLASIKNGELPSRETLAGIGAGEELVISIDRVRQMGPIVMFHGQIEHDGKVFCKAQMKVFKEYQT
jgi:predicted hotdog family 3-hydroxylacyl-ACP dehydratase